MNVLVLVEESGFLLEIKGIKDRLEDILRFMGKERRRDFLEIYLFEEYYVDFLLFSIFLLRKNLLCFLGCEMEVV